MTTTIAPPSSPVVLPKILLRRPMGGDVIETGRYGFGVVQRTYANGWELEVDFPIRGVERIERDRDGWWTVYRLPHGPGRGTAAGLVWLVTQYSRNTLPDRWTNPHGVSGVVIDVGRLHHGGLGARFHWHVPSIDDAAYVFTENAARELQRATR